MMSRWLPRALAVIGAAALTLAVLLRYAEFALEFGDGGAALLLTGLGPVLVSLAAAASAWLVPAARLAAAGALIAVGAMAAWSFLWGLAFPVINVSPVTAVGALLVGLAGVLLLTRPEKRT